MYSARATRRFVLLSSTTLRFKRPGEEVASTPPPPPVRPRYKIGRVRARVKILFYNLLKKSLLRASDCRPDHLPTATRSRDGQGHEKTPKADFGLWLGTSPVHSLVFFHNRDIFCYFGSFLVDSGRFQLTSIISTFLLEELVVIKHGRHVVSCSYRQPRGR